MAMNTDSSDRYRIRPTGRSKGFLWWVIDTARQGDQRVSQHRTVRDAATAATRLNTPRRKPDPDEGPMYYGEEEADDE
jgi:hypothetical protein